MDHMIWMRFTHEGQDPGPWFKTGQQESAEARRERVGLTEGVEALLPGEEPPSGDRRVGSPPSAGPS